MTKNPEALASGLDNARCTNAPAGLAQYRPYWDQTRALSGRGCVYEDDSLFIASDFECGNGRNIRQEGSGLYALDLEPEPGNHEYSNQGYYFCFGLQDKRGSPRQVRVRLRTTFRNLFADGTGHVVLHQDERWFHLPVECIRPVAGTDVLDLDLPVPGAGEAPLFVSNFHWHPFTELARYLNGIAAHPEVRLSTMGSSAAGRPICSVELGQRDRSVRPIVIAQTSQPSEMLGIWACRAIIDFLLSDCPSARRIRDRHRVILIPATNPDGMVLGMGVSHPAGRFPVFEGKLTADGSPDALPEMTSVWNLLLRERPWIFVECHGNNWKRRPGHMLLRYRPSLIGDSPLRRVWEEIDRRLEALPDTLHGNWTDWQEGFYRETLGFMAVTRLGCIAYMIKQHDRFPLEQSMGHAVSWFTQMAEAYELFNDRPLGKEERCEAQ